MQQDDALFANAQQVKNMLGQIGTSSGSAIATVGLQWRLAHHYAVLNANFLAGNAAYADALQSSTAALSVSGGPQTAPALAFAMLAQTLLQQSTLLASMDYFAALAIVACIAAIVMACQRALK